MYIVGLMMALIIVGLWFCFGWCELLMTRRLVLFVVASDLCVSSLFGALVCCCFLLSIPGGSCWQMPCLAMVVVGLGEAEAGKSGTALPHWSSVLIWLVGARDCRRDMCEARAMAMLMLVALWFNLWSLSFLSLASQVQT